MIEGSTHSHQRPVPNLAFNLRTHSIIAIGAGNVCVIAIESNERHVQLRSRQMSRYRRNGALTTPRAPRPAPRATGSSRGVRALGLAGAPQIRVPGCQTLVPRGRLEMGKSLVFV